MEGVCRVCLAEDRKTYRVADTALEQTYDVVTSVKLQRADRPTALCCICVSQLRRCRRFIETARESNDALDRWYSTCTDFQWKHTERPLFFFNKTPTECVDIWEPLLKQDQSTETDDAHRDNAGAFITVQIMNEVTCNDVHSDPLQLPYEANDNKQTSDDEQDNTQMSGDEQDNTQMSSDEQDNTQMSGDEQDNTQISDAEQDNTQMSGDEQDNTQISGDENNKTMVLSSVKRNISDVKKRSPKTPFLKARIIQLYEDKKSINEIARLLNIAKNTVRLWIRRHRETGDVERKQPGPAPVTYTTQCGRHNDIVTRHTEAPYLSPYLTAIAHGVSEQTVRRHLHVAKLECYQHARKIALKPTNRRERVQFAEMYKNFDWQNKIVIFTDEKTFKSDKDGRNILWRKRGERHFSELGVLPDRTSEKIMLAYWGWMSSMGPGELVEVNGQFYSSKYLELLRDVMLPAVRAEYPEGQIYLIEDNCAVHCAPVVQEWLCAQNDITLIRCPSKSPDLNLVEHLWSQMILNWDSSKLNVRSKEDLKDLVSSTWESMRGSGLCNNLVASMRNRLQQVIDFEGRPIPL